MVCKQYKICLNSKLAEEIKNIINSFGSLVTRLMLLGKTINNTISKLNRLLKQHLGSKKFPVYLRLSYIGKETNYLEDKIKETVKNTFGAVNFNIIHFK